MKKFGLGLIIVLAVGGMIAVFVLGNRGPAKPNTGNQNLLGTQYPNQGQQHIPNVTDPHTPYNSNPPTSGPHYFQPAPWGVKDSELPDEILVHNLEHGGMVIQYKPDLPADQIQQLKDIVGQLPESDTFHEVKVILVPRAKNDQPISLTAWTYLYSLDKPDATKIKQFYADHLDKGPELVP